MPQIVEIIRKKDVEGISYALIGLNLFGDMYKTFYFFFKVIQSKLRNSLFNLSYVA